MSNWHKMSEADANHLVNVYLWGGWAEAKSFVASIGFGQDQISRVLRKRAVKNATPRGREPGFEASPNIPRGEKSKNAKLTAAKVLRIRADDRTDYQIAKSYGVHANTITAVKRRNTWKHV